MRGLTAADPCGESSVPVGGEGGGDPRVCAVSGGGDRHHSLELVQVLQRVPVLLLSLELSAPVAQVDSQAETHSQVAETGDDGHELHGSEVKERAVVAVPVLCQLSVRY